jgi:hypothetical protein
MNGIKFRATKADALSFAHATPGWEAAKVNDPRVARYFETYQTGANSGLRCFRFTPAR